MTDCCGAGQAALSMDRIGGRRLGNRNERRPRLGVDSGRRVGQLGGAVDRHHGTYRRVNPPLAVLVLLGQPGTPRILLENRVRHVTGQGATAVMGQQGIYDQLISGRLPAPSGRRSGRTQRRAGRRRSAPEGTVASGRGRRPPRARATSSTRRVWRPRPGRRAPANLGHLPGPPTAGRAPRADAPRPWRRPAPCSRGRTTRQGHDHVSPIGDRPGRVGAGCPGAIGQPSVILGDPLAEPVAAERGLAHLGRQGGPESVMVQEVVKGRGSPPPKRLRRPPHSRAAP
jgi:hypothetical protein